MLIFILQINKFKHNINNEICRLLCDVRHTGYWSLNQKRLTTTALEYHYKYFVYTHEQLFKITDNSKT